MRRLAVVLWLVLARPLGAAADVSVSTGAPASGECNWEKGPFQTGWSDPTLRKIGERLELAFAQATPRHALYHAARHAGLHQHRAVVIDRASGREISKVYDNAVALVEDAAGDVIALVAIDVERGELRLLDPATGDVRWRQKRERWDDSAAVALDGDRLIVATFHRNATGSRLLALDFKTGALRWTADVEQLNVAHSEYYNDVTLALAGGQVTMQGLEAGGCYVQTFDAASGRRLTSRKWNKW